MTRPTPVYLDVKRDHDDANYSAIAIERIVCQPINYCLCGKLKDLIPYPLAYPFSYPVERVVPNASTFELAGSQ